MIIDHTHPEYMRKLNAIGQGRYNGARYYSMEIVRNIIPNVKTDRGWVTVNVSGYCEDGAIVFIHNNLRPERYDWLRRYHDLVLVCGTPDTVQKVKHLGYAIYLPLSVDVADVAAHRRDKDKDIVYAGRKSKLPAKVESAELLYGLPRDRFLSELARYRKVYAVGRVAIEAQVLGCQVETSDPERYPDVQKYFPVLDNIDAAHMLQSQLNLIDKW